MIFVTVGTQLAFDRLIKVMDRWAGENPQTEVFAQIGPSDLRPSHLKSTPFLTPDLADLQFRNASLVVSHAGMGSIITALKYHKPILILPRMASYGEHRNDHQLATAKWLGTRSGINVAWSEADIAKYLDGRLPLSQGGEISDHADPQFIDRLRRAIFENFQPGRVVAQKKPLAWSWLKHF